jgi:hypothetical protein
MKNNKSKPIVVGVIGHICPSYLADFKKYLEEFHHFRLIRFQESNNKLWIVQQKEDNYYDK